MDGKLPCGQTPPSKKYNYKFCHIFKDIFKITANRAYFFISHFNTVIQINQNQAFLVHQNNMSSSQDQDATLLVASSYNAVIFKCLDSILRTARDWSASPLEQLIKVACQPLPLLGHCASALTAPRSVLGQPRTVCRLIARYNYSNEPIPNLFTLLIPSSGNHNKVTCPLSLPPFPHPLTHLSACDWPQVVICAHFWKL